MNILITGANGYIGKRILPELINANHNIICAVRDKKRLGLNPKILNNIKIWEVDFNEVPKINNIPENIDFAYYLIHAMSSSTDKFDEMESKAAINFNFYMNKMKVKQVIYLSGIVNDSKLSKHLKSRNNVEKILYKGNFNLTVLRAGIIVGSGSSSFEIIRDLCEKLPIMITPKWVLTKTQPIAIRDVIKYLIGVINNEQCFNKSFDIGSKDILTYKDMLIIYSKIRKIKILIFTIPFMTPKLSSYWLYFITSTSYNLAKNLVDSMKIEVICKKNNLNKILNIEPISYEKAIQLAFKKVEQNLVISSWKDSFSSSKYNQNLSYYIEIPNFGCLKDIKKMKVKDSEKTLNKIFSIGGKNGWYYANFLWEIRGFFDKLIGGVGLRRGRTNQNEIYSGDSLDFWRVIYSDKQQKRLLLFAEMKLPGEAWLEFKIENDNLIQIATFRPKGLLGRLYWYSLIPFHFFIFKGMIKELAK